MTVPPLLQSKLTACFRDSPELAVVYGREWSMRPVLKPALLSLLAVGLAACVTGSVCGPGTHDEDGVCLVDEVTDTGSHTDTDTGIDTGFFDPCEDKEIGVGPERCARNFVLQDQNDNTISLWKQAGDIIYLEFVRAWCGACKAHAPVLQEWFSAYRDDGLTVITVLYEDEEGEAASLSDANDWVDEYDITYRVLADNDDVAVGYKIEGSPVYFIIDREMVITEKAGGTTHTTEEIEAMITDLL